MSRASAALLSAVAALPMELAAWPAVELTELSVSFRLEVMPSAFEAASEIWPASVESVPLSVLS